MTPALVGEKFIEPTQVDYKGQKALVFVFGDLAVQREGTFILRYRVFDIFSRIADSEDPPLMGEIFGGPFRVYSTREFPGLEPSTDLTRVSILSPPILSFLLTTRPPLSEPLQVRCPRHPPRRRAQVEEADIALATLPYPQRSFLYLLASPLIREAHIHASTRHRVARLVAIVSALLVQPSHFICSNATYDSPRYPLIPSTVFLLCSATICFAWLYLLHLRFTPLTLRRPGPRDASLIFIVQRSAFGLPASTYHACKTIQTKLYNRFDLTFELCLQKIVVLLMLDGGLTNPGEYRDFRHKTPSPQINRATEYLGPLPPQSVYRSRHHTSSRTSV